MSARVSLAPAEPAKSAARSCASCGEPLQGRYCAKCGEESVDHHAQTVRHFISHTLLHEVLHLDGTIWLTLRSLLFHPAFLTAEYCAGRRRRYVNPLRLLITAVILYALLTQGGLRVSMRAGPIVLSTAPAAVPEGSSVEDTVARIDRLRILRKVLKEKEKTAELDSEAVRDKFHRQLERFAEPLSFANVILLSIALYALFHRKRNLLVENAVFSIHFISFVLFSSLAFIPVFRLMARGWVAPSVVILAGMLWQFAYLSVAVRRFYFAADIRRLRPVLLSVGAAVVIYVLNSAFITGVQLLGGLMRSGPFSRGSCA